MLHERYASEMDVTKIVGEVDPLLVARILAIVPTVDELGVAARMDPEAPLLWREPPSPGAARIAAIRAILAELERDAEDADRTNDGDRGGAR